MAARTPIAHDIVGRQRECAEVENFLVLARDRARTLVIEGEAGIGWANPVAPATSRGPQPVLRRQAQIARSAAGASRRGLRAGRLERSNKQTNATRSRSLACCHRRHQRCAVAGETLKRAAACRIEQPPATASTSSRRPASPSLEPFTMSVGRSPRPDRAGGVASAHQRSKGERWRLCTSGSAASTRSRR
jgi:hypothetical protein